MFKNIAAPKIGHLTFYILLLAKGGLLVAQLDGEDTVCGTRAYVLIQKHIQTHTVIPGAEMHGF